jgi:spore coat polysaccharide biosynthesis predicted glycosyltransferase SpsG
VGEHDHALVWIDHQEARIFQFKATEVDSATVRNTHPHRHIHHNANTRGSGHAPVDERFLERVTRAIKRQCAVELASQGAPATASETGAPAALAIGG